VEHDLFGKPIPTFPDALGCGPLLFARGIFELQNFFSDEAIAVVLKQSRFKGAMQASAWSFSRPPIGAGQLHEPG